MPAAGDAGSAGWDRGALLKVTAGAPTIMAPSPRPHRPNPRCQGICDEPVDVTDVLPTLCA